MASITVASNAIVLEVLDQHNYDDWSSRLQTYLLGEDLWDVVNAEPPNKPQGVEEEAEFKAWTTKNAKALHAIKISCGTCLFSFIKETRTAKIAWEVLEKQFKSPQTLYLEKKEREKSERSLHTPINVAAKTRDEAKEIKASEGDLERETSLRIAMDARQTRDAVKELVPGDDDEEFQIKPNEGGNENTVNYEYDSSYDPFLVYVFDGDWDNAKECLKTLHPNAVRARMPHYGYTAAHLAVGKGHMHIIKELISLMTQEDLEIKDNDGYTALHAAVRCGNVDIVKELVSSMREEALEITDNKTHTALHEAIYRGNVDIVKELVSSMREEALEKKDAYDMTPIGRAVHASHCGVDEGDVIKMTTFMVEKNKKILSIVIASQNFIPVVEASSWKRWELTRYLYSVTPLEALTPPQNGSHGASFIYSCLKSKEFDIAWDLLSRCPSLTVVETVIRKTSPIMYLARVHSTFLRGMRLRFWQKWIYDRIGIPLISADSNSQDISINISKTEDDRGNQSGLISSVTRMIRRLVKGLLKFSGISRLYEMKSTHARIFEFIHCMGQATIDMGELTLAQSNMLNKSMFEAIEQGNVEFVTRMCKANPSLVNMYGDGRRSIFHFAIECRQEEIYSLIYGLKKEKRDTFGLQVARFNNNMLHGAGNLSPLSQFNRIQGASLQMQRELQWFKEVESVVPVTTHDSRNHSENLTARELFHKNHKKLMEEAEISMKGTATSCTVVGALIVTIMFAAAFTIPGGNNGNTGLPMFIDENLFLVFIVSDTTALVSSTTAVIIFLGILTSRYSEDDYLKNLPTKMMIGLFTLFISIATMMTAFCCGLVIMLHGRYSWVTIPIILFASIPVISFMWMLFPLLVQTFISTYGPGIFNKKIKPWIEF